MVPHVSPPPLDAQLSAALQQRFGLAAFREGQRETIRALMAGRDALVVMPTGAGKSLCFQLPALLHDGITLVISPLIALMKDQVDALQAQGLPATFINSALTAAEQGERLRGLHERRWKLCYIAPERLRNARFMAALRHCNVSLLAVDEAHCISQWGHDFRPDYRTIGEVVQEIGHPPVIALTATATPQVQEDIERQLELRRPFRLVTGFNRPNLRLEAIFAPGDTRKQQLLKGWLDGRPADDCGLIYVGRRREAADVAGFIRAYTGRGCAFYHAGLSAEERNGVQQDWMEGRVPIVVATNAFGMGVDKPDVRFVIHYTLPGTVEAYYQEAGRAGRDGDPAHCLLLHDPSDARLHEWFIENEAPTLDELRDLYRFLRDEAIRNGAQLSIGPSHLATVMEWRLESKARTAMGLLEAAGLVELLDENGNGEQWQFRGATGPVQMDAAMAEVEQRRAQRRHLLNTMLDYAQSHDCRRQYLLDYFGDATPPVAEWCCDNCQHQGRAPSQRIAQSPEEKAALAVLDAVAHLDYGVGRQRLAQLLGGSRRTGMERYFSHPQFGQLSHLKQKGIMALINDLVQERLLQIERNDRFALLALSRSGERAIRQRSALTFVTEFGSQAVKVRQLPSHHASSTAHETLRLFDSGLDVAAIAEARGLAITTVQNHLADLIGKGELAVERVVPEARRTEIEAAVVEAGTYYLSPIKELLPDHVSYSEIRCVVAALRRAEEQGHRSAESNEETPLDDAAQTRLSELEAWRSRAAYTANQPPYALLSNTMLRTLARTPPADRAALEALIGAQKAAAYGDSLLATLQPAPPEATPVAAATASPITDLQQRAALARLRAWRTEEASEQNVPAYVICTDAIMRTLVLSHPRSPNELLDVPGIGPQRAERYGEAILEILAEELGTQSR